ncbi:flagellar basal-body rod protein FlgG [Oceanotoga sp. DSM 15011]|jgi:flagellar basal-body rod protein FlgG|uniref:Flagellar basal-body rod protein FlgG n=1 Tax=Oceanotoga teriensis TaxID=515440 RepID=A0AA45HJG1_9BACT|nr:MULTISPECIES: flagellar basal-body rod protein FlgG [Oceanotoga]MDN5342453.1 flagellar basal-body rod protein FlgG [Oceanotoga sp.]MDO7975594.1 flagellar basal-body rod protein FlgG [Oceanotoga teriensis]PWJ96117.1 flagellar basal-body rod protein FlgG [Oceanotoga teriensis]UYO99899.1 flagellar basal-body rod protein FlgG [Oceanotoga sp. DSM 15011]
MLVSLYSAATGMNAEQRKLDIISNNLSNVETTGFKRQRAEFQDLLYQAVREAGTPTAQDSSLPTGLYVGHGTTLSATNRIFSIGNPEETGGSTDIAIMGDGFLQVQLQDGRIAYTRDGSLKRDGEGRLTTSNGLLVVPNIVIPANSQEISISPDGIVSVKFADDTIQNLGNMTLVRFVNPAGLKPIGNNLYTQTPASGDPVEGIPNQDGFGPLQQGYLEKSNVDVVKEMVNMIVAQRAYDINSKTITTSDEMLRTVSNLKR